MRSLYVDLDDVICETARELLGLLYQRTGRKIAFQEITSFNLGVSFRLPEAELIPFMKAAHQDEILSRIQPVKDAAKTLRLLKTQGWEISIVTGRPPSTFHVSQEWLRRNDIHFDTLLFIDKYSRHDPRRGGRVAPPLTTLQHTHFNLAVEDSPLVVDYLLKSTEIPVMIFDRPWNADYQPDLRQSKRLLRRKTWHSILEAFTTWEAIVLKDAAC